MFEDHVQRPPQCDTYFLFEPWQLHQVNTAPQHPPDDSGKLKPEDSGDARAATNRRKLPLHLEYEGSGWFPLRAGADILSNLLPLSHSMLCGWRVELF